MKCINFIPPLTTIIGSARIGADITVAIFSASTILTNVKATEAKMKLTFLGIVKEERRSGGCKKPMQSTEIPKSLTHGGTKPTTIDALAKVTAHPVSRFFYINSYCDSSAVVLKVWVVTQTWVTEGQKIGHTQRVKKWVTEGQKIGHRGSKYRSQRVKK